MANYAVTHLANEQLEIDALPSRYLSQRPFYSTIYYLVTNEQFSAMHKLPTDEIYYFHFGDPLEILVLDPEGGGARLCVGMNLSAGEQPQLRVPRNWWQGSRPLPGKTYGFSLVSTSMAPAYMDTDPVFGTQTTLVPLYPEFSELIKSLTRK